MKSQRQCMDGLNVLRLAATFIVMFYHLGIEALSAGLPGTAFFSSSEMAIAVETAITLFFLISGLSLCYVWCENWSLLQYGYKRIVAIFPQFWILFFSLFFYGEILHGNNATVPRWKIIFSILGLDGYLLPVTTTYYKIGEWFLGCMILLYCLFPILLLCQRKRIAQVSLAILMALLWAIWPCICPSAFTWNHTVLGWLPVFAFGIWLGTVSGPIHRVIGYLFAAVFTGSSFFATFGQRPFLPFCTAGALVIVFINIKHIWPESLATLLHEMSKNCYGVFLVHHVFATLIVIPFMKEHSFPLVAIFAIYGISCFLIASGLRQLAQLAVKVLRYIS